MFLAEELVAIASLFTSDSGVSRFCRFAVDVDVDAAAVVFEFGPRDAAMVEPVCQGSFRGML